MRKEIEIGGNLVSKNINNSKRKKNETYAAETFQIQTRRGKLRRVSQEGNGNAKEKYQLSPKLIFFRVSSN